MTIEVMIASPRDRERVVAELWQGDSQIAEVSRDGAELRVEFYSAVSGAGVSFDFGELVDALRTAQESLTR